MPEIDPKLADYGARVLGKRRGADIRTDSPGAGHRAGQGPFAGRNDRSGDDHPGRGHRAQPGRGRPARREGQTRAHRRSMGPCAARATRRCGRSAIVRRSRPPTASPIPTWPSMPCARPRCWPATSSACSNGQAAPAVRLRHAGDDGFTGPRQGVWPNPRVRVRGVVAWFVRRTYYLLQMPGWGRRLRIMIDWTFALLFRPDVVKISLDSEATFAASRSRGRSSGRRARGRVASRKPRRSESRPGRQPFRNSTRQYATGGCDACHSSSDKWREPMKVAAALPVSPSLALGRTGDYLQLARPRLAILVLVTVSAGWFLAAGTQPDVGTWAHALLGTALLFAGASRPQPTSRTAQRCPDAAHCEPASTRWPTQDLGSVDSGMSLSLEAGSQNCWQQVSNWRRNWAPSAW